VRHDEFARHEDQARNLIGTLGQLSREAQASPDFAARVMARADALPVPCRGLLSQICQVPVGVMALTPLRWRVAAAVLSLLLWVAAVPQYVTWIKAYMMGVPSGSLWAARLQERLWEKNFICATRLNHHSANYAAIAGDHVTVVTWACPSGDVLVSLESLADEPSRRSVWIALDSSSHTAGLFDRIAPQAFAAPTPLHAANRPDPIVDVLCQKKLSHRRVRRHVRLASGRCVREEIDIRTGTVVSRQSVSCDSGC
jgi:hypothetical protein